MESPDSNDNEMQERAGWRRSCLEAIAILFEHYKLILIATALVGAAAVAVQHLIPKVYMSVAYLGPFDEQPARAAQVIIHSDPVLSSALEKFPGYQPGLPIEERRARLLKNLNWKLVSGSTPKSATYTLALFDSDPGRAQRMLTAIIDGWLTAAGPRPDLTERLTKALQANEAQAADLSQIISELKKRPEAMFPDSRSNYFPPNIADIIKMRTETAARIFDLTAALRAGSRDWVFSEPTLPEQPSGPGKVTVALVSMGIALVGLIAALLLDWRLKLASKTPAYAPIFARIRRAIPW